MLQRGEPGGHVPAVAVAYSGGRDSTALLHATLAAVRGSAVEVVALHVHHGLSAHADEWLAHCQRRCANWAAEGQPLRFDSRRVGASGPDRGDSLEAWAREARYAALAEMALAQHVDLVLLAHHRRDQAETVLLQALRGGGPAGLAAMPRVAQRRGLTWARPWLKVAPDRIVAYLQAHGLTHVEDDSNADARLLRNRLRLNVWPVLAAAFPQAETALAAVASRASEALACADELASIDLQQVDSADGLRLDDWLRLAPARRGNVLRAWIRTRAGVAAPASLVARLQQELPGTGPARWPMPAGFVLERYRGRLRCLPAIAERAGRTPEARLGAAGEGIVELPGWGGRLRLVEVRQGGLAPALLDGAVLRRRSGGERFQAAPGRPPRSLKKQFQAAAVPAWQRDGPLVHVDGELVYVPGLGHDARSWAPVGTAQIGLQWEATDPNDEPCASCTASTARSTVRRAAVDPADAPPADCD